MAATDDFGSVPSASRSAPARRAFAITPSDSVDLANVTRGLYVGTGGDLSVIFADDSAAVTLSSVPAGMFLPFAVKRVRATGTLAAAIVGVL